jgi:phosphomannomutase|tara:strand:+ start:14487 stop:15884 length:1398 start_codon:yes stop_codon:yes gene_type:complete
MPPKFGTSGLRGLVTELTPDLVASYVRAFVAACPQGSAVHVGWDLRPSSPAIAEVVLQTVQDCGLTAVRCGTVPTPALALAAMNAGCGAVMITGSHIPADRNGLKFYVPSGEVSKEDETQILAALDALPSLPERQGSMEDHPTCAADYVARYTDAFGDQALAGMRIGVYQHSSVARDIMVAVVQGCGGTPVPLAWSDTFIPVDTEAVDPETRSQLAAWCAEHALDALISTDGDADRPMLADASGAIVPGDVLGPLTARALGADVLCTPVSSNSMIGQMDCFATIQRTRIGSPFVIAAMEDLLDEDAQTKVAGYEANGGFLLGFAADAPTGSLAPLMTRDCLLPVLAPLAAARAAGQSIAEAAADLPPCFTAADRLQGIEQDRSGPFLAQLKQDAAARAAFFDSMPAERDTDHTDGLRVTFEGGAVVHLRPSGNAPEFRCYTEAATPQAAQDLLHTHLGALRDRLG